jgi:hypothetical protein
MMSEIRAVDTGPLSLRFRAEDEASINSRADENAPLHDSRRGLASYYRYRPRDIEILRNQERRRSAPYTVQLRTPIIHQSALRRIKVGHDGYAPISSTLDFQVALVGGGYEPAAEHLRLDRSGGAKAFDAGRGWTFNLVWWRRVTYFLALAITVAMAAFPAYLDAKRCSGWACFLSPLIEGIGGFLPGILSGWTSVAAANPATLLVLLALLIATLAAGSRLDRRIGDTMRMVWYRFAGLHPTPSPPIEFPQPTPPRAINRAVQRLRTSAGYIRFWNFARRTALPVLASLGTVYLAWALLSVGVMSARESWGSICVGDKASFTEKAPPSSRFTTNALCAATHAYLREGGRYQIDVFIPADHAWRDGDPPLAVMPASPNGLVDSPGIHMAIAAPFRRHWHQPWFKLMARVGMQGADVYAPDWRLVSSAGGYLYRARIATQRTGPLFLYVNDGVTLGLTRWIYGNNHGEATVTVTPISLEHHVLPDR